jgi:XTP/dITP diphosphohydrolase
LARVVLVGSSPHLPGLFPFQSWEALVAADRVWARHPADHPSAPYLALADVALEALDPADLDLRRLDLSRPGDAADRRLARALLDLAESDGIVTYLLGPTDGDDMIRTVGLDAAEAGIEVEFVFHGEPPGSEVLRLAEIERSLRDPVGGCPWDLEQDHRSLARHLVEETYELLDAIDGGVDEEIAEELGDVLLQVVFHAQIAADRGAFDLDDVARGIADKLVRRHPHVFGDAEVADADEVKAKWDELKAREKRREGPFEGVPSSLPALQLVDQLISRAGKLGFAWSDTEGPAEQVREELAELRSADDTAREEELGDLLVAIVALARAHGLHAEQALRRAAGKFRARFETVLALAAERGLDPSGLDANAWTELWQEAKDLAPDLPSTAPGGGASHPTER